MENFYRDMLNAYKRNGWVVEEEFDDEVSIDYPTSVVRCGVRYRVWTVDEQCLDYHNTLEPSDLGRHYYIVNGAFMFLD